MERVRSVLSTAHYRLPVYGLIMVRPGRPRKLKKRKPSGGIRNSEREPQSVGPTDQMQAHKAQAKGGEVGNVLSYLPLRPEHKEALETFQAARMRAGFVEQTGVADYGQKTPGMSGDEQGAIDRQEKARKFYDLADDALLQAGRRARDAVHALNLPHRRHCLANLAAGAEALRRFFERG